MDMSIFRTSLLVIWLVIISCLLIQPNQAADDTGQYLVMGLGNSSCDAFLSEDALGAAYYMSWLAGYLTTYNQLQKDTYSIIGESKDVQQIESWLRDYCTVNGAETFESAARNLLRNLKYFRLKKKP